MKILQSVVVKQVLTEKSKEELLHKFENNILQLQKECEQILFEQKKMEKNHKGVSPNIRNQFETEKNWRLEKMKLIQFQIEQLELLPIGSELKEKELQAIIEVQVGDSWNEGFNHREIIIKDGIVQEIR